ncbi:MAG: class I SAM-dependent methyltransferase [Sphingobacteriia bacterium]|nr:class I SAM-dependent methyltransferase [Sphingobacteriia bacterium]
MNVQEAYDQWSGQYDTNQNKTRDLEALSLRQTLSGLRCKRILEIGCGTGKNTAWLQTITDEILAVDLSDKMLAVAKNKITSEQVQFQQADITQNWDFATGPFDLITFSLVLEHISDLQAVLHKAYRVLEPGGKAYIGELHPFKQYNGTKARFDTAQGIQVVTCFNHHISDFTSSAKQAGFEIELINEYFDDNDRQGIPRILILVLRKG